MMTKNLPVSLNILAQLMDQCSTKTTEVNTQVAGDERRFILDVLDEG